MTVQPVILEERRSKRLAASRRTTNAGFANACYFRSGPPAGGRKALLKITDRCDLRCAHCFVSATADGQDMSIASIVGSIPRLREARVENITLTGGEPLVHPDLAKILECLVGEGFEVTVCTNAVSLSDELVDLVERIGHVSFNVSLDGMTADSHGKFRGQRDSFDSTIENSRRLARSGLLKGLLSTPNALADDGEYGDLFEFADELDADYLLMNPLSSFGRGIRTRRRLRADERSMTKIQARIEGLAADRAPEPVFIRFPNTTLPLSSCMAGDIFYVFVDGDVAVCPYLVFATDNPGAKHHRNEFIVGNLFDDEDIATKLESYKFHDRYEVGSNDACGGCAANSGCGKGCPAAVIAAGGSIGEVDAEVCPTPHAVKCS